MRMLARALTLTCTILPPAIASAQPTPTTTPADIIANIPCQLLTRPYFEGKPTAQWIPFYEIGGYVRGAPDWRLRAAPYGVPYRLWSNAEFSALKARGRQCNPRPEDNYTLSLLLDAVGRQQIETVGYNERQGTQRNQADARRSAVLAELAAIRQLPDATVQVQRLRELQSAARSLPDLAAEVTEAMDTALIRQDRQREEAVRLIRMRQVEEQLAAERLVVEREETAARQRKEGLDRSQAARLAMERETQEMQQSAAQQESETQRRVEAERAALAERGAKARQALATQQQAEASEAVSAQAARDRAAQVMFDRDAARRAQADEAERQRAAERQVGVPRRQAAVAQAIAAQRVAFAQLGIPERYLAAQMMMRDETLQYVPGVAFRDYLAVLLQSSAITLTAAEARTGRHIIIRSKQPTIPIRTTVWRLDGDELYLAGVGQGDNVTDLVGQDLFAGERMLEVNYTMGLNELVGQSPSR